MTKMYGSTALAKPQSTRRYLLLVPLIRKKRSKGSRNAGKQTTVALVHARLGAAKPLEWPSTNIY